MLIPNFGQGTTRRMIFGPNKGDRLKMTALIRKLMFLGQPLDVSSFLPFLRPLDLQVFFIVWASNFRLH